MKNIIELKNITKNFPGIVANDDISLAIRQGEVFALLGENGAGKSTLMSILFGLYRPDKGEIFIRGQAVRILSPAHAASLSIGMVHQHFQLVEDYTITENIILGVEPKRLLMGVIPYVDLKSANEKIAELSKNYGLEVEPESLIRNVGISMRQRVEILKMLYREAEILIFDEPTSILTPQEVGYLLKILENLRSRGKTIIMITHKLNEIKQIADRCAVLNRGKLVGVYDVAETSVDKMAAYMVGRELEDIKPPSESDFGENVLTVRDLRVMEFDRERVSGVSFSIREGEIFSVAGVDGNGQTQLADAIAGLLDPLSGEITLMGCDITHMDIRKRVESGLSYVPENRQDVGMLMDFDLAKNSSARRYYKPPFSRRGVLNESDFEDFSHDIIEKYDIRCARGSKTITRSMSGGNQQKAIVGREIEQGSKLMIFVQPTRGLDIGATRAIHEHILRQRDEGHAILLISMELDEVKQLADTIGVMYEGRINRIAPARELGIDEIGEYMMGVK